MSTAATTTSDPYELAGRAVVNAIKAHQATAGRIARWPGRDELIPPDVQPSPRDLPAVRVEVLAGSGPSRRMSTEGGLMLPATMVLRHWTRGEDGAEARALWNRLRRVLDPSDEEDRDALDERLERAGVWSLRCTQAGLPTEAAMGNKVVESAAVFDLQLLVGP